MIKYLLFLLLILGYIQCLTIEDIAYESAKKYCPIIGFRGSACPIANLEHQPEKNILDNIVGGIGFDTIRQLTRLPVKKSQKPIECFNEELEYFEFSEISKFYDRIYSNKDAKAGMYSQREGADQLFVNFYGNTMKATLAQKKYTYYQVNSELELDEYFEKAIDLLPQNYDKDIYDVIINFWGDSFVTESNYGGIFENQRALRECFNAEISDVQKNIDSLINNEQPSKDVRFLDYSLYSSIDIIGGNPEITNYTERLNTFKTNPVFIHGTKLPIWEAIPEGTIRQNMKIHIRNIDRKIIDFIDASKDRIKNLFFEEAKKEEYIIYSENYAVYDYAMLPYSQYWNYGCQNSRPDCYYCHEDFETKKRWGFSRACVTFWKKNPAIRYSEITDMGVHSMYNDTIDNNGYYQMINVNYFLSKFTSRLESIKIRSGCNIGGYYGPKISTSIIPNIGWKYGFNVYYCIKCIPWIRYVTEWGQAQEYFECSCPKTI